MNSDSTTNASSIVVRVPLWSVTSYAKLLILVFSLLPLSAGVVGVLEAVGKPGGAGAMPAFADALMAIFCLGFGVFLVALVLMVPHAATLDERGVEVRSVLRRQRVRWGDVLGAFDDRSADSALTLLYVRDGAPRVLALPRDLVGKRNAHAVEFIRARIAGAGRGADGSAVELAATGAFRALVLGTEAVFFLAGVWLLHTSWRHLSGAIMLWSGDASLPVGVAALLGGVFCVWIALPRPRVNVVRVDDESIAVAYGSRAMSRPLSDISRALIVRHKRHRELIVFFSGGPGDRVRFSSAVFGVAGVLLLAHRLKAVACTLAEVRRMVEAGRKG